MYNYVHMYPPKVVYQYYIYIYLCISMYICIHLKSSYIMLYHCETQKCHSQAMIFIATRDLEKGEELCRHTQQDDPGRVPPWFFSPILPSGKLT